MATDQLACDYNASFQNPNKTNYAPGEDVYVKVHPSKYQDIEWMELYVGNQKIRRETSYPYEWCKGNGNSDSYLRNLQPGTYNLICKYRDKCGNNHEITKTINVSGNGNGNAVCKYKSWYKYPKNNGTYRYGEDVYVRVDTEKYQDIKEMELYVNNKFVRKESNYPYEWCKGQGNSDGYLRNLKRGTYNLKCIVKTKCGQSHEYLCKFYVR